MLACLVDRLFFDVCDGIFLNYSWKESGLQQSKQLSSELGRTHDVYVGVDVFGRYGRHGGFNTVEVEGSDILSCYFFPLFHDDPVWTQSLKSHCMMACPCGRVG